MYHMLYSNQHVNYWWLTRSRHVKYVNQIWGNWGDWREPDMG